MSELDLDGLNVDEIFDGATKELVRRFKDPQLAAELPGTTLMQIVLMGAKKADADAETERNKSKDIERGNAVEIIVNSNASPERKKTMLLAEQARMEAEYAMITRVLSDMEDQSGDV